MIEEFIRSKGIDPRKFVVWAFGEDQDYQTLHKVPELWNAKHPEVLIRVDDLIQDSLKKMTNLYLKENQINS